MLPYRCGEEGCGWVSTASPFGCGTPWPGSGHSSVIFKLSSLAYPFLIPAWSVKILVQLVCTKRPYLSPGEACLLRSLLVLLKGSAPGCILSLILLTLTYLVLLILTEDAATAAHCLVEPKKGAGLTGGRHSKTFLILGLQQVHLPCRNKQKGVGSKARATWEGAAVSDRKLPQNASSAFHNVFSSTWYISVIFQRGLAELDGWFQQPCNLYFGMATHLFKNFTYLFIYPTREKVGGSKSKQRPLKFLNLEPREVDRIWQMQDFGNIQVSLSMWALLCHRSSII